MHFAAHVAAAATFAICHPFDLPPRPGPRSVFLRLYWLRRLSLSHLSRCSAYYLLCVTCDLIKCIPSLFSLRHALRSAPSLCLLPYHPFNVYLSLSVQPAAEAEGAATRLNAKRLMQGLRAPYFFALVIRDSGPRRLPFECHLLHHPYHPSTSAIST